MRPFALLLLISAFGFMKVSGQKTASSEIERIDSLAKSIARFVEDRKPQLVFADTSNFNSDKPKWQKFGSAAMLEKFRESKEVYDIANVWQKDGKVVCAVFTRSSPSGDWAKYLYLYFRTNGSLGKAESELRTFYGNSIVRQSFYFDQRGKQLKNTIKYFDLSSNEPKDPSASDFQELKGYIEGVNYFISTKDLPFARLLKLR